MYVYIGFRPLGRRERKYYCACVRSLYKMNRVCFPMHAWWKHGCSYCSSEVMNIQKRKATWVTQVAAICRCTFRTAWFAVKIWQKGRSWSYVLPLFYFNICLSHKFRYSVTPQQANIYCILVMQTVLIIITKLQSVCWIINLWLIIL